MIALVTGAYRGLGLETVKQLTELNYTVILTGRNDKKGNAAAALFRASGNNVYYHHLDVNLDSDREKLFYFIDDTFGMLDVLINNAGIHYDTGNDVTIPDWNVVEEATSTNFLAPWKLTVALLPLIKKSKRGRIVNVSSGAGSLNDMTAGTPAYSASKAALNVLTIQLAAKLKPQGIKVNAVCPGWVRTDMGGNVAPRSVEEGARGIVWAAALEHSGPTGGFFRDGKPINW